MIETYLFLKKARFKKKLGLYKQALLLTLDFTSVFYMSLLVGYFIYSIVSEGGLFVSIRSAFNFLDTNMLIMLTPLLLYFLVINLMKGIKQSGVTFSESDYKLLMLPYEPKNIWIILLVERLFGALIKYSVLGLIVAVLTPLSLKMISLLIGYLLIINGLSTVVEWKMFNLHLIKKLLIIIGAGLVVIGLSFLPIEIALFSLLIVLLVINLLLYKRLYKNIDFEAVVLAGNYKTWNIPFVSYMSKTKTVKKERQTALTKFKFFEKPLNYQTNAVNKRMLYLYLENNLKSILQLIGVLIILIVVAYFKITDYMYFIVALSIIIYASFSNTFFRGFLQTKLIEILPFRMNDYKKVFLKGVLILNAPIVFVYGSLIIYQEGVLGVLQLIMFILVTYLLLALSIEETIAKLIGKPFKHPLELIITYLLLILTALINYYFMTLYLFLIIVLIIFIRITIRRRAR